MSKELEALNGIKKVLAKYISEKTGVSVEKHFEYLQYDTEISIVAKALTPPTADEVCEALSKCEDLDKHSFITYMPENKSFTLFKQFRDDDCYEADLVRYEKGTIYIAKHYPPHLITLIGRFYKAQQ